jgi:hypothetical protein
MRSDRDAVAVLMSEDRRLVQVKQALKENRG